MKAVTMTEPRWPAGRVMNPLLALGPIVTNVSGIQPHVPTIWCYWGHMLYNMRHVRGGDLCYLHHVDTSAGKAVHALPILADMGVKFVVPCAAVEKVAEPLIGYKPPIINYVVETPEDNPKRADVFKVGILGIDGPRKGFSQVRRVCEKMGVELVDWTVPSGIDWNRSVEDFYSEISCYVCSSTLEGGPMPPLEALTRGDFAVSTAVGVIPEVHSNGLFIYDGTDEDLEKKIGAARVAWSEQKVAQSMLPRHYEDHGRFVGQWAKVIDAPIQAAEKEVVGNGGRDSGRDLAGLNGGRAAQG